MIVVMGATGQTGSLIAGALLRAGEAVRAIGRDGAKLSALATEGAQVRQGDARDTAFLADAFTGADAVYTLLASDRTAPDYAAAQAGLGEAIVEALARARVPHVVALSSLGADVPHDTGVVATLHAQEIRLEQLAAAQGTHVRLLRPASFFENFREALPLVRAQGIVADAVDADVPIPMVGTEDVAAAAVAALRARDWVGITVRELLGPRDLSHREATRLLGNALGLSELPYVQLPGPEMAAALIEAGLSPSFAHLYVEMAHAISEGRLAPVAGRNAGNTTPTAFETFAATCARTASPA